MSWAAEPVYAPVVQKGAPTTGYKVGDQVTVQQGIPGVPTGLLLALTTEPIYYPGVTTKYGFKRISNG